MLAAPIRSENMRPPMFLCLAIALCAGPGFGTSADARRHSRVSFHPPTHCPELGMDGFCHYDSGWRPATDNPLFSPLRAGDPRAQGGPSCEVTDSRGRTLLSYETETEDVPPALRIAARLVRFHPAGGDDHDIFVSSEGRLTMREGAMVARDHESDGHRATLTFTDRRGRAHVASVRIDCGV
jgi:hypothetical protein